MLDRQEEKLEKSLYKVILYFILGVLLFTSGLSADGHEKKLDLEFGVLFQQDLAFFTSVDQLLDLNYGPFEDLSEVRRFWFWLEGDIADKIEFRALADVSFQVVRIRDLYLKFKFLPVHFTVGHIKVPFGLEMQSDPQNLTFLERSVARAFSPSWNAGLMLDTTLFNDRVRLAGAVYRDTDSYGRTTDLEALYNLAGRITGIPFMSDDLLLHLGFGYIYKDRGIWGTSGFRAWSENFLIPDFQNTGSFRSQAEERLGFEAAFIMGPLSIQGEYMIADITSEQRKDPYFHGYYVQASYWLTGEKRNYLKKDARFGGTELHSSILDDGTGGIELAARYSFIDLDDQRARGAEVENITFGLNWHQTKYTAIMLNYVISSHFEFGDISTLLLRFQGDFSILF